MTSRCHHSAAEARRYYKGLPKITGSVTAAVRKWKAREANRPPAAPRPGRVLDEHHRRRQWLAMPRPVPLGACHRRFLDAVMDRHPRLRNWNDGAVAVVSDKAYQITEKGSNSDWNKRSTFRRGVQVQSYATCTPKMARLHLFGEDYRIPAPRGYRWDADRLGLHLRGRAGEYHPTAAELVEGAKDGGRSIAAALREAARVRREARKEARRKERDAKKRKAKEAAMIRRAEAEGATVCLADSRRAGNCVAGSLSWARQHGLDPTRNRHYRPSEILAAANGDASRVAIVVAAAIRRHRAEMERGYAILEEHSVDD